MTDAYVSVSRLAAAALEMDGSSAWLTRRWRAPTRRRVSMTDLTDKRRLAALYEVQCAHDIAEAEIAYGLNRVRDSLIVLTTAEGVTRAGEDLDRMAGEARSMLRHISKARRALRG